MKHLEQMEQNSQCSLCGKRYHITAFHGGYVCECCIDYIETHAEDGGMNVSSPIYY